MSRLVSRVIVTLSVLAAAAGCGRMGPPVPPEMLAPEQVEALKVTGTQDGVNFAWESPKSDQRGEALKMIDGYRIYRKRVERAGDVTDESIPFEVVNEISDHHLIELEKERDKFRQAGRPAHRARVDKAFTVFNYTDRGVSSGNTYLYKVVPTNNGGVESQSFQLVKVLWRGDSSEVKSIDRSKLSMNEDYLGSVEEE